MGRDKALLEIDGEPLWRRQTQLALASGASRVFLSVRPDQNLGRPATEQVVDTRVDLGPLSGIATSIDACRGTHLLVLAVDMPALNKGIISRLLARCGANSGVIPHVDGEAQPLAAVYTRDCLDPATRALAQAALSVRAWAADCLRLGFCMRWDVPASDAPLFANWNSPDDVPPGGFRENPTF